MGPIPPIKASPGNLRVPGSLRVRRPPIRRVPIHVGKMPLPPKHILQPGDQLRNLPDEEVAREAPGVGGEAEGRGDQQGGHEDQAGDAEPEEGEDERGAEGEYYGREHEDGEDEERGEGEEEVGEDEGLVRLVAGSGCRGWKRGEVGKCSAANYRDGKCRAGSVMDIPRGTAARWRT